MAILWNFNSTASTGIRPSINSQLVKVSNTLLTLRNPWISDSVFMGKIYTSMTVALAIALYPDILDPSYQETLSKSTHELFKYLIGPLTFSPFIAYRVLLIKKLSHFQLNRKNQGIYYKRGRNILIFKWSETAGGVFKRTEFAGASLSTQYALALAPRRPDGTHHQKDCLWIDSNDPTNPDIKHVAEVWEYLRHFMDHGPDNLPPPGEPNWWHKPLHAICLTPAEAWRHYAPWRSGEPGEMQGKKNWQLPFWAVLFPYNFCLAVCWYVICRLFNVRAAPPPPEAFEEPSTKPGRRKRP